MNNLSANELIEDYNQGYRNGLAKAQADDKRNYWLYTFAGQAMQGMLASTPPTSLSWPNNEDIAERSFGFAKTLLKELEAQDE